MFDYSPDRLEIIIAPDASTDHTDEIVNGFADRGVRLIRVEGCLRKTETQYQSPYGRKTVHRGQEVGAYGNDSGNSAGKCRAMSRRHSDVTPGLICALTEDNKATAMRYASKCALACIPRLRHVTTLTVFCHCPIRLGLGASVSGENYSKIGAILQTLRRHRSFLNVLLSNYYILVSCVNRKRQNARRI